MVVAGSPFAPDTASGWITVTINLVISSATIWALVLTMRTNRRSLIREQDRDRHEKQDLLERRAFRQGASVRLSVTRENLNAGGGRAVFTPAVVNVSSSMVFSATVEWVVKTAEGAWTPRTDITGLMAKQYIGRVPPGATEVGGPIFETTSAEEAKRDLELRLTFVDAYGDQWQRDPDHTLTLLAAARVQRP